ncbi:drug/metabolite transporter (DMT)-like permease [Rhizobium pisi]|uniref:DMT family transporter n=1 Tax=Rhizobium pisi TaxID=574561 RepID=A0A3R9BXW9_9HYPH|nr:DMT family transporter [Rhizobium pisi]MBB3136373.1 drug/metabolite transporter (DMT)-like permease [Rhizobium pisi]RSB72104.1 DMT family transporter [Rhizobium pisi]TCA51542.1 DMT family transporter [Rhizobium pisi]
MFPTNHRKGLLLTAIGGLALSVDIPLTRLADGELWSILAARSIATLVVTLVVAAVLRIANGRWPLLVPGWPGLITGVLYGLTTVIFLLAVFNTSTANVVFIVAFNPMFAALLSWIFLKERPAAATLIAMAAMIFGVGLIVRDGLSGGHLFGDAMALLTAFIIAAAITISRASGSEMGFVSLLSTVLPATVGLIALMPAGGFSIAHPAWIVLNGAVMMPLAFWCLATGPRYLSGPEVGMFYLLETVLAPIWVWLILAETPATMTLLGGGILVAAIAAHSAWMVRRKSIRQMAG